MPFALPAYYGAAGASAPPPDRNQYSINFPGAVADYLNNANSPGGAPMSALAWIRPTANTGNLAIARWVGAGNTDNLAWRIGFLAAGQIAIGNTNSGGNAHSGNVIAANTWCSTGFSMSSTIGTTQLYKDGATTTTTLNGANNAPIVGSGYVVGYGAGNSMPGYSNPYSGLIASFALWNSVLSAAEMTELHNAGAGATLTSNFGNYTSSANLSRHWIMEEGTGTSTADEVSSPANDLAFNGSVGWSTTVP